MSGGEQLFAPLDRLVEPRSVAIVGASDNPLSVGGRLVANVIEHSRLEGEAYLVNPRRDEIAGRKAYESVAVLPEVPDVAVVALSAERAIDAVRECGEKGIAYAVVVSSGFSEGGSEGAALERRLAEAAAATGIRVYGPNCPGLSNINKRLGLNFSPAFSADLTPGVIGLATQGGGLGRAVLQAMERGLGVAQWLSAGNEADLDIGDFIYHLACSSEVKVIVTIIEGIKDGARFAEAALEARRRSKPIVAIKVGRSEYGARAALSHTSSMTGEAAVNSAVFEELGIVEVNDLDDLIDTAALFAQRLPRESEQISVYAYSGGTAALAADMVGAAGLRLAELGADTVARLEDALPRFGTHTNPVDTGTEILHTPELIAATLEPVLSDPEAGVVMVPVPIEMGETTAQLARVVVDLWRSTGAAVLPVWITDRRGEGYRIFADAGLVPVSSLGNAVDAIGRWAWWGRQAAAAEPDWRPALTAGRSGEAAAESTEPTTTVLDEWTSKQELAEAGIAVPAGRLCRSAEEAATAFDELGGPVAIKVVSAQIAHKSDIGGVRIGIDDRDGAAAAFEQVTAAAARMPDAEVEGALVERMATGPGIEAVVGVHRDPVFGHILTFGAGGVFVEMLDDHQRRMPPLGHDRARGLIASSAMSALLEGHRGASTVPTDLLEQALVRISAHVVEHREEIEELEVNPLWIAADGETVLALDALIVKREAGR